MTRNRLWLLADLLPAHNAWTESIADKELRQEEWSPTKRRANVLNDPAFGFKFVRTFAQLNRPLPNSHGVPPVFFRAFDVLTRKCNDSAIEEAISFTVPGREGNRAALEALLLCRSRVDPVVHSEAQQKSEQSIFEDIARIMGTSTDVVLSYEALFFAVRARLDDRPFIASLVYPRGVGATRTAEFRKYGTHREKLFIAACEKGWDRVLSLTGLGHVEHEELNVNESSRRLRVAVLEHAVNELEFGDAASPLVGHGLKLAMQDDSPAGEVPDSRAGLTALGRLYPIRETIMNMQRPGIKEMLRLQQEDAQNNSRRAGIEKEAEGATNQVVVPEQRSLADVIKKNAEGPA